MSPRRVRLLGVASGIGARIPDCQDGPAVLHAFEFFESMNGEACDYRWAAFIRPPAEAESALESVAAVCRALARQVRASLHEAAFPLVIGGDHSCAIGTWSGVRAALPVEARLGLLWVDAHMDSHTFETSPSGAIHGMPLACLLGHGEPVLTGVAGAGAKLDPRDVCLFGVRSYEAGEAALLWRLGVRVYTMDEIRQRGVQICFAEAWQRVTAATTGFGLSLDLDALEPAEEPGVGSPVPGGMRIAELSGQLAGLRGDPRLLAMEIVEYNPYLDRNFETARAAAILARSTLACDHR